MLSTVVQLVDPSVQSRQHPPTPLGHSGRQWDWLCDLPTEPWFVLSEFLAFHPFGLLADGLSKSWLFSENQNPESAVSCTKAMPSQPAGIADRQGLLHDHRCLMGITENPTGE